MKFPARILAGMALVAGLAACGQASEQPPAAEPAAETTAAATAAVPEWVGQVAAVANAIEAQPSAADSILQAGSMTREAFDSLIYTVAADPQLSAAYQTARGR